MNSIFSLKSWHLALFALFISFIPNAQAGGPLSVASDGTAIGWDNGSSIPLHPESGSCATFSNGEMLEKLDQNISQWENIDGIDLNFTIEDGEIGEDIDINNYTTYLVESSDDPGLTDGLNPVMFDEDGSIVSEVFGTGNEFAVLGFAGPDGFDEGVTEILDGQALFNCLCLEGSDGFDSCDEIGVVFTEDDLDFTMVHEIGHMIGFDHTQVNQAMADGTDCDLADDGDCDDIPAMYPVSIDPADQLTPARDDEVIALTLYGNEGWEDDFCTVTGSLTDINGDDLRCADVQATSDDTGDTIAVVSGAFAAATDSDGDGYTDGDGECEENCGAFTLFGLDPSKDYTITVRPIDTAWEGGSGINPCSSQLAGIEVEEIATVEGCSAGEIEDLGTIETTSDLSGSATDDSGDSGDSGSAEDDPDKTNCGIDKNFSHCPTLASCALHDTSSHDAPLMFALLIMLLGLMASQRSNVKSQK